MTDDDIKRARATASGCDIVAIRSEMYSALDALEAARRERDEAKQDAAIAIGLPTDFSPEATRVRSKLRARIAALEADLAAAKRPEPGTRCDRCHRTAPNANGCARCAPERLGELLMEANGYLAAERDMVAQLKAETERLAGELIAERAAHAETRERLGRSEMTVQAQADTIRTTCDAAWADRDHWKARAEALERLYNGLWPITDVLRDMSDAVKHLLRVHDCDHFGHEEMREAVTQAHRMADGLDAARKAAGL